MTPALAEAPALETGYHELAIADIVESKSNPRRRFDDESLKELSASILQVGILEPLIVRSTADGYELVAGARRLRAARAAGLADVPCLIRTLSDLQVLEIQVTENLQRKDVHPLEEADAYAALMKADRAYTVEAVAARVGRSASYVYQRLKLKDLCKPAREAFEADEITAAHAVRLARLGDEQQADALHHCFHSMFDDKKGERKPAPVAMLDSWIKDHTAVDPTARQDVQHYLPELDAQLREAEVFQAADTLLQLSDSMMPGHYLGAAAKGLLNRNAWKEVKSEKACTFARRGCVVHGGPLRVLWVCAKKGCPKHWPVQKNTAPGKSAGAAAKKAPAYDYKAEEQKRAEERKRFDRIEPLALSAIARALAKQAWTEDLLRGALEAIVDRYQFKRFETALLSGGGRIGLTYAGQAFALALELDGIYTFDQLRAACKKHGVDLKAIEKTIDVAKAADASPAKDTAKKVPAKKGGKK